MRSMPLEEVSHPQRCQSDPGPARTQVARRGGQPKSKGTFVTRPKLGKNIMYLQGFTVDMRQRGMKPASHLREQAIESPTTEQCEKLRLSASDKVLHRRWLPMTFPWRWSFPASR